MQRRIRETRDLTSSRKSSVSSSTGIKIAILFTLSVLTSCGGQDRVARTFDLSNPSVAFDQSVGMICLSGEGKGKIKSGSKSHSFNFESKIDSNEWLLGISIPFLGEEVLKLNLNSGKASGGLYNYLIREVKKGKNPKRDRKVARYAFKQTSRFLKGLGEIIKNPALCSKKTLGGSIVGKCKNGIDYSLTASGLQLSTKNKKLSSSAHFSRPGEEFFQISTINTLSGSGPRITLKYAECYSAQR